MRAVPVLCLLIVLSCVLAAAVTERPYVDREARTAARCAPDMALVPGGAFQAGATADQVGLPDYEPDIVRDPRPRGTFETDDFCIDHYEFPGEGRRPLADVTWVQARVACELVGKRLCTEDEWTLACGGPLGRLFPYGDLAVPGLCHADVQLEGQYDLVVPGGTTPTCRSPYGTWDQEGNVSEWVEGRRSADSPDRWVLGGTMWPGVYGRGCQARHAHPQVAPVSGDDGFRCCSDPR